MLAIIYTQPVEDELILLYHAFPIDPSLSILRTSLQRVKFCTRFTDDIQVLVVQSRRVYYFMCMIWWHSCLKFFSVTMHSLQQQKVFQILAIFKQMYIIRPSLGLHQVYQDTGYSFLIWDIFCKACSQWRELPMVVRTALATSGSKYIYTYMYRKTSSRGAYGHDPFWSVVEEYPLDSTRSDSTMTYYI